MRDNAVENETSIRIDLDSNTSRIILQVRTYTGRYDTPLHASHNL